MGEGSLNVRGIANSGGLDHRLSVARRHRRNALRGLVSMQLINVWHDESINIVQRRGIGIRRQRNDPGAGRRSGYLAGTVKTQMPRALAKWTRPIMSAPAATAAAARSGFVRPQTFT